MSQSSSQHALPTPPMNEPKNLTRAERLQIRNQIMMAEYHAGISKDDIADKFQISVRQLNKIIRGVEEGALDWYEALPKSVMIAIHRENSKQVFHEIERLMRLRNEAETPKDEFRCTCDIIDAKIKYDKMISEGATLQRTKELTDQAEKLLAPKD